MGHGSQMPTVRQQQDHCNHWSSIHIEHHLPLSDAIFGNTARLNKEKPAWDTPTTHQSRMTNQLWVDASSWPATL